MGTTPQQELRLRFPGSAYLRIVVSVVAFTVLGYVALHFLSHIYAWDGVDWLRAPPSTELIRSHLPWAALILSVTACSLLWLRQPRGARITWDDGGITEWDGEGVRMAIGWAGAMRTVRKVQRRKRSTGERQTSGEVHQLRDPEGRTISLASDYWVPDFMMRRRTVARSVAIPGAFKPGPAIEPDGSRGLSWTVWPMRVGYAVACVGLAGLYNSRPHQPDIDITGAVFVVAGMLLCLRNIRPFRELLSLIRLDRSLAGARPVTLEENEGSLFTAREADGRQLRFDIAELAHPDGLLRSRRGPAWVAFDDSEEQGEGGAYRGSGVARGVRSLELAGTRRARRTLEIAVVAEMAARFVVAATVAAPGIYILM